MKRIKTFWLVLTIFLLSNGLFGQDTKSDVLSFSLSYITPYLISSDFLECEFAPIYMNVEANIHYKPFDRFSFSSGLGYFVKTETRRYIHWEASPDEPDYYHTSTVTNFRIPIQLTTIGGSHLITQTGILRQYIQMQSYSPSPAVLKMMN